MSKKVEKNNRIDYLDSLRGIAILLVIAAHVGSLIGVSGSWGHAVRQLGFGVQLFFVISAFTIYLTYARSIEKGVSHPVQGFLARRLTRILPIYWLGILIYTIVYGFSSRGWLPGPELWHYPVNIFLLNIWHPDTQSSVVPGGWSISVEVMFYLSFPFIVKYVRNFKTASIFLFITLIPLPLLAIILKHYSGDFFLSSNPQLVDLFWARNPLNQFACFAFGFIFYFAVKEDKFAFLTDKKWNLLTIGFSLLIIVLTIRGNIPYVQHAHLYSLAFCILAISLSYIGWALFSNQIFSFFGRISYSSYLLHFLILKQLGILITPGNNLLAFMEMFVLTLVFTTVFAYVSYRLIEQPAMKLGRYFVNLIEQPSSNKIIANG